VTRKLIAPILWLVLASVVASSRSGEQIPGQDAADVSKPDRPYNDGPLTEADFQGQRPTSGKLAGSPFQAYLFLDINWSSQYRTAVRGRVATAYLTQFDATAASDTSKSWHRWGKNKSELLDHEQGHFDITQIHALRLEIKFRKLLAAKKPPAGTGQTEAAAVEGLNNLLDKQCRAAKAVCDEENVEYDRLTTHGAALEKQRELRRVQQETLRQLNEELKRVKKK
jgi:hypothetical protein